MTEPTRLRVVELTQTCGACPSQWEGRTADGRHVYVRFRYGYLAIGVGATIEAAVDSAISSAPLVGVPLGEDGYNGYLDYESLKASTSDVVEWP